MTQEEKAAAYKQKLKEQEDLIPQPGDSFANVVSQALFGGATSSGGGAFPRRRGAAGKIVTPRNIKQVAAENKQT